MASEQTAQEEIKKLKEENEKLKKENKELNDRRSNFYLHFTEYVYEYDIQSFDEWLEMEGLKRIFTGKIDEIISD
jgi:predicted RNase H-like nuclease (RuvC/YqgF family)